MKKITLALSAFILLLGSNMANASSEKVFDDVTNRITRPIDYRNADPIVFVERGIEFYVFPTGDFDFNTATTTARPRNATYGAPRTYTNSRSYTHSTNVGVRVEHDTNGRVRRVGNVFINYDAYGRIKRVGSVYMSYNSFALSQIGNLVIKYDRHGRIVKMLGSVNGTHTNNGNNNGYQGSYNNNTNNSGNYNHNDEDLYYYRKGNSRS